MPVVVDLHLLDGEPIVSPYNCNFAIGIFPAYIALDDHDVLMLDDRLYTPAIGLEDNVLPGATWKKGDQGSVPSVIFTLLKSPVEIQLKILNYA